MTELPEGWEARNQPPTLFRRFEFERYSGTRNFLDALAALAEETGLHPQNINFSSTYVNITLDASQEGGLSEAEFGLATRINLLYEQTEN
ncbi:4a-hydroxytetrahydrobiopterin dehydratase [Nitrosomonas halophila]|uniref:4a-hydroxytetrahydrobiopterin dehydratase n=1 Tax=Nitrosomonas halophila TaxID=44576 RepID=A0A1H3BSH0_9PROT|nr:4a-hydroxytetrahydrobiopterin dehydratase [Nitrosomonas halophila]SDX44725.1 Pterin-4a-carbinolamine dehydratase [Nitrosomonas halophila]